MLEYKEIKEGTKLLFCDNGVQKSPMNQLKENYQIITEKLTQNFIKIRDYPF